MSDRHQADIARLTAIADATHQGFIHRLGKADADAIDRVLARVAAPLPQETVAYDLAELHRLRASIQQLEAVAERSALLLLRAHDVIGQHGNGSTIELYEAIGDLRRDLAACLCQSAALRDSRLSDRGKPPTFDDASQVKP